MAGAALPSLSVCRRAAATNPGSADVWLVLGAVTATTAGDAAAVAPLRRALIIAPNRADIAGNLANAYERAAGARLPGGVGSGIAAARGAVLLNPAAPVAWGRLAVMASDADGHRESVAAGMRALRLSPETAEIWTSLGGALRRSERRAEAFAAFARALSLNPALSAAWAGLGLLRADNDEDPGAAYVLLDRGVLAQPDLAWSRVSRALVRLRAGRTAEGWDEYEWRMKVLPPPPPGRPPAIPSDARPTDLHGRSVLASAEQGMGDAIQFIRLVSLLRPWVARIAVECHPALRRLLRGAAGVDVWVENNEDVAACDGEIPLMSLPRLLGLDIDTIPASVPYLTAEPAAAAKWRLRMTAGESGTRPLRVGLAWRGSGGGGRTAPFDPVFAPLTGVKGVRFIGLHREVDQAAWAAAAGRPVERPGDDFDAGSDAFIDTAAILESLDLLISIDTATAHLAGALGRPVWLVLSHSPDWRWFSPFHDVTPWYPRTRLFRRPRSGDWSAVGEALADRLAELAASFNGAPTPCFPDPPATAPAPGAPASPY